MLLKVRLLGVILLALVALFTLGPVALGANQAQITAALGAGWNLGNQLEANNNGTPSETAWGNPTITQSLINAVKAAGFKSIRIPVSLLNKIGSAPNYTIDSAWLSRIKQVVDYAYNQGLYVFLDAVHGDGYTTVTGAWLLVNSGDQTTIKAKYQKVWQQIATTFASYDEKLIFESMNEVFDGNYSAPNTTYYANLNAYNQIFVDTVRQTGGNNASRWLLIPGWNTNIDYTAGNYGFALPTDNYRSSSIPANEKRIMISAHYYSPWDFCGEENGNITQWGSIATNPSKKSTWGQEDYMDSQLKMMYDKFVTQGYPVVIGEYGSIDKTTYDSTNNTYRQYFAKTLCATCKKYGAVPVYWDNGWNGQHGFGLFDRNTYAVTQQGIINNIMSGIGGSTNTPTPTRRVATPTPTRQVTPTPTRRGATPTPTRRVTPTPTTRVSGGYVVTYVITADWGSGANADVTIKNNTATAVNGWTLAWSFPGNQTITNMWNATYTQSGAAVSAKDAGYNATIGANGGTVSFGFGMNYSGTNAKPTAFTLNGTACTVQ
ncbi:MAG: cellulase family glycosylhydrolase [Firmicutes bacterium]|nr:cellulase family glycosylhydrolase [Bacillota bacterium]